MDMLTTLTGDTVLYRWEFTHQRAFEEKIKEIVEGGEPRSLLYCIKYGADTDPIFMKTDGCATGISGVVT